MMVWSLESIEESEESNDATYEGSDEESCNR